MQVFRDSASLQMFRLLGNVHSKGENKSCQFHNLHYF